MTIEPRLIVTDRESDGRSVFLDEKPCSPISVGAIPGAEFYMLWGTEDGRATVGSRPQEPKLWPFFPGTGGTRVLFLRWAPESSAPEQLGGEPEELAAEAAEQLPGLMDVFEPSVPGMHTTDTVDYVVCLEGELHLELDGGNEVKLTPGTCIVQRGTRHAWHNRSDKPALMCAVLVGADRTT